MLFRSGRLAGNWFTPAQAAGVAFAYDTYDPSRVVIATGAGFLQGVFGIAPGDPAPRDVSPASGRVLYSLSRTITGPAPASSVTAYMLVEMTDATHIRMETFLTRPTDFTAGAGTYSR